jgi:hypothetical protein
MEPYNALREQIVTDIEDLTTLEDLVAAGETSFQVNRDRLESAIQIKVAILQGLENEHNNTLIEPGEEDRGMMM